MNRGVLLVAHGKRAYWDEACTLARSLNRFSPGLTIAVASDLAVPENRWRADGFAAYVPFDFRHCGGVSFKMHLDRITPFRDTTLFIDSDSICYDDVSGAFSSFASADFVTLGRMLPDCHWFEDGAAIRREFGCDGFPFFCGDFYLFRNTQAAAAVFATARDIASRFRSLGIRPLGGWCNDEPAFSLSMVTHGIPVQPCNGDWILQVVRAGVTQLDLNYATGTARAVVDGVSVSPRIVHFSAHRSQPLYFRERYRVRHRSPAALNQIMAHVIGFAQSAYYRIRRRLGV